MYLMTAQTLWNFQAFVLKVSAGAQQQNASIVIKMFWVRILLGASYLLPLLFYLYISLAHLS